MAEQYLHLIIVAIGSVVASSGFWMFILKKLESKDASQRMLLGLGHDRILFLGIKYLERGWVSRDEYENIHRYLYIPYKELGGNGTVERIVRELGTLPIREYRVLDGETHQKHTL